MKIRHLITLGGAIIVGAALIAGPATAAGQTEATAPVNDSWLTAKTKIALFADGRVNGSEINVETQQGIVTIRGKVNTAASQKAAGEIAKGVNGVKSVKNELQVVAPSERKTIDDKDEAITARVKANIAKESSLKNASIDVKVNAGVVSLTGDVPDILSSAQASWAAWQVPGVKSVKNDLTLKEKADR
jgi:hyperosmotically inducible protein